MSLISSSSLDLCCVLCCMFCLFCHTQLIIKTHVLALMGGWPMSSRPLSKQQFYQKRSLEIFRRNYFVLQLIKTDNSYSPNTLQKWWGGMWKHLSTGLNEGDGQLRVSKSRRHWRGNILDFWGTFLTNIYTILLNFIICRKSRTYKSILKF